MPLALICLFVLHKLLLPIVLPLFSLNGFSHVVLGVARLTYHGRRLWFHRLQQPLSIVS
jgi:hypothetical protein